MWYVAAIYRVKEPNPPRLWMPRANLQKGSAEVLVFSLTQELMKKHYCEYHVIINESTRILNFQWIFLKKRNTDIWRHFYIWYLGQPATWSTARPCVLRRYAACAWYARPATGTWAKVFHTHRTRVQRVVVNTRGAVEWVQEWVVCMKGIFLRNGWIWWNVAICDHSQDWCGK